MSEGDYGIKLPVTVSGTTLTASDSLRFTFKDSRNGKVLLVKEFANIEDNTVDLEFTQEESALFSFGNYVYSLDWYQDGNFQCNIVEVGILKVGDKA